MFCKLLTWQKLSEKVEVTANLQVLSAPTRRYAIATLGSKYDFQAATFRAQIDSTGKVSALLEQRFIPAFAFLVLGCDLQGSNRFNGKGLCFA